MPPDALPPTAIDAALTRQLALADEVAATEGPIVGWKAGATSVRARATLGTSRTLFGNFRSSRLFESGDTIDVSGLARCVLEPELCFTLADPLPPAPTVERVFESLQGVAAAFEVLQYPASGTETVVLDAIAEGVGAWGLVVGPPAPPTSDFRGAVLVLTGPGGDQEVAVPELDDHLETLARLSDALRAHGRQLEPGQHVITGAFTKTQVDESATWRAQFQGVGSVAATFVR